MPQRILHVLNGLGTGGIEKYVLDLFKHMNPDEIVFDFLIRKKVNMHEELISSLGGRVFYVSPYPEEKKQNYIDVDSFFSEHCEYSVVHIHAPSLEYVTILKLAKRHNIRSIILHSHCSSRDTFKARIRHYINRFITRKCATDLFACSDKAAKWMFGKRDYKFVINGIDTVKFTYSDEVRNDIRQELELNDCYVWGHIGRICKTKNQEYLLHLFKEQLEYNKNSKLVILGEGNDLAKLQDIADKLGITSKVLFLGFRADVYRLMCAMDVLVFPSLAEGFPITLIEAQSMGLPCVVSDSITKQVALTDNVYFLSLSDDKDKWLKTINQNRNVCDRKICSTVIRSKGFDIRDSSKRIEEFYLASLDNIYSKITSEDCEQIDSMLKTMPKDEYDIN